MADLTAWSSAKRGRHLLVTALTVWFGIAFLTTMLGMLEGRSALVILAALTLPTVLCLLAAWRVPSIHAWVKHTDFRLFVGLHAVRLLGVGFFVLYALGVLNKFALVAGLGSLAVGVTALVLVFAVLPITRWRDWWVVLAWNVFASADVLFLVLTTARQGLEDMDDVAAIAEFPMSLLPTFLIPLLLTTHVLIFWRLRRTRRRLRNAR